MEEEFNELRKYEKVVIGVSGGPDSMALLYCLSKLCKDIIVCHVNYHTRKESDYEKRMVEDTSNKLGCKFYCLNTFYPGKRNFEAWARDERYKFFKEVCDKNDTDILLLAHHKDDLIETYIMQKRRGNLVKQWGFHEKTSVYGMKVVRPFITKTKQELVEYCENNKIPYSIDSTNLEDVHTRNKIRHSIVEKMTIEEKNKMVETINNLNLDIDKIYLKINALLINETYSINDVMVLSELERQYFFYELICKYYPSMYNKVSWTKVNEVEKILLSDKPNLVFNLSYNKYIVKQYKYFYITDKLQNNKNYSYIVDEPSVVDNEVCSCDLNQDLSALKITKDSYPLTIRNVRKDDTVTFGNVTKKVNRIFIDEKIPMDKRKSYPVIVDRYGKVVYFPLYNSDIQKNYAKKLQFVIK